MSQPYTLDDEPVSPPPILSPVEPEETTRRSGRSRQDHSKREKHTKFGEYILGNTIGEGEFGKVKLGWKQEGGVQVRKDISSHQGFLGDMTFANFLKPKVAIKLIKKDQVGSNPVRMAKIMREVTILKQLTHPNIVQLHKMEESERHFGIVLEYASGGELFDYILNHRYLKDNAARRLFAQLVSGVGYLHKKGIVHRDLKLENLLLDRNRNIIITDFGFANTFDPTDELTEEEELNLSDREFVKRMGLDKVKPDGSRRSDLMQTSCGSPCYAAPELVVSDLLYTGRKTDVWSLGVILVLHTSLFNPPLSHPLDSIPLLT
jgi:protein-serine/threonine kinase